jgi:hypothetical protein
MTVAVQVFRLIGLLVPLTERFVVEATIVTGIQLQCLSVNQINRSSPQPLV